MHKVTEPPDSSKAQVENPVLVAIDFSEDSKAALVWACKFADCVESRLIVLHVVHDLASHPGFYHSETAERLQPMQAVAETMMDEFLAQVRSENPELRALSPGVADLRFVPGLPPTRIVEVAGLLKAGLIAIGSRGLTCLPHKLLGAVAERVAELSSIPVVIVKSETHAVLDKKEIKRWSKQRKRDREQLKEVLGLGPNPSPPES